jgi:hypothetical protein
MLQHFSETSQHFSRNICFINYSSSIFCKMLQQFCVQHFSKPAFLAFFLTAGGHGGAGSGARSAGARPRQHDELARRGAGHDHSSSASAHAHVAAMAGSLEDGGTLQRRARRRSTG